jgi:uncharacterized protein (DUF58 family)
VSPCPVPSGSTPMETEEIREPTLFILPLILFFVGLVLFIALLHGRRDLALLALLILCTVSGTRLWSRLSVSRIQCRLSLDRSRVFPGDTLRMKVAAENNKFTPLWLQVRVPVGGPLHPSGEPFLHAMECGLLWHQRVSFSLDLAARQRGLHRIGPLSIRAGDLLGFFPRGLEAGESVEVLVYPRLVPIRSPAMAKKEFFGIPGARNPVPDPVYILGTRDYQHSQPARHIHWKASARHQRLQQKVFEPSGQEKVLLFVAVDQFAQNKASREFEKALEVVASLALQLDGRGCAVGLMTNGIVAGKDHGILPAAKGSQHVSALLEILARLEMKPRQPFLETVINGVKGHRALSSVHFSYEAEASARRVETYLLQRKIPVAFVVSRTRPDPEKDRIRSTMILLDDLREGRS